MSSPQPHVLIAGAGIAGPALAILLNKNGFKTTIVERAPGIRTAGQQVDLVGPGIEAVRFMGVEQAIRDMTVHDEGLKFVDENDYAFGTFPVSDSVNSPVREIEILRGDMGKIFYEATKEKTESLFDDRITGLAEKPDHITINFKNSPDRDFDVVVAADGLGSRTRELAFGKPKEAYVKNIPGVIGTFMIPWIESDGDFSRIHTEPGVNILLRPNRAKKQTSAYLIRSETKEEHEIIGQPEEQQKAVLKRIFTGLGWEVPRMLDELEKTTTFYLLQTAQVKMDSWVKGRVVVLGDAGYSPSGLTGLGTTAAVVGAHMLAGCLITHAPDLKAGLEQYERDMRPFVKEAQKLIPGVPGIANPKTAWGVWTMNNAIRTADFLRRTGVFTALTFAFTPVSWVLTAAGVTGGGAGETKLPVYEKMLKP